MLKQKFQINEETLTRLNEIAWPRMVSFPYSKIVDSLVSTKDAVLIEFLPRLQISL